MSLIASFVHVSVKHITSGARVIPIPVIPNVAPEVPIVPDVPDVPVVPAVLNHPIHHESDDEYVDAEEPVAAEPEEPGAPEPVAPEAEAVPPAVAGPPIAAFHPQPEVAVAREPFALPHDIRPNPYNLRDRNRDN